MEHSVFLSLTRLNFQENYVKSTYFYKSQSKLFSRNIFQVKEAQHCENYGNLLSLTIFWQKFRESNDFTKEITKSLN